MPKRPTNRDTKRPAPYTIKAPTSRQTSNTMATALTSPMTPWPPHNHNMWSDPHMGYQQSAHQQHQSLMPSYVPMSAPPTTPALPAAPAPIYPGQSALWSPEEDNRLLDAKSSGLGWNEIGKRMFPNKSGNACRKRHERLMAKLRTTDWDNVRIQNVMAEYNAPGVRENFWGMIAHRSGEQRWEDVERVCFQQGLKGLRTTNASSHSRGRSRGSSGGGGHPSNDYDHASPYGEYEQQKYDHHDDSGIDLGAPGPSRRTSQVMQQTNIPPLEHILREPSTAYEYS